MSTPATQVTITEEVTDLTVTNTNAIALDLTKRLYHLIFRIR